VDTLRSNGDEPAALARLSLPPATAARCLAATLMKAAPHSTGNAYRNGYPVADYDGVPALRSLWISLHCCISSGLSPSIERRSSVTAR